MDDRDFDALTRSLVGAAHARRSLFRRALASAAAALLALVRGAPIGEAKKKPDRPNCTFNNLDCDVNEECCSHKCCGNKCCAKSKENNCCGATNKKCVNLGSSRVHCGKCGHTCGPEQHCKNGKCVCDTSYFKLCGVNCCPPGKFCKDGVCFCQNGFPVCGEGCCQEGWQKCCGDHCCPEDGSCCGDHCCQKGNTCCEGTCCPEGEVCQDGVCQCPSGGEHCYEGCCPKGVPCCASGSCAKPDQICGTKCCSTIDDGEICCDGGCVKPRWDVHHCGGCDKPCHLSQMCCDGVCREVCSCCDELTKRDGRPVVCCTDGKTGDCCFDGDTCCGNYCADLTEDPKNCGKCGQACPRGQYCLDGSCH